MLAQESHDATNESEDIRENYAIQSLENTADDDIDNGDRSGPKYCDATGDVMRVLYGARLFAQNPQDRPVCELKSEMSPYLHLAALEISASVKRRKESLVAATKSFRVTKYVQACPVCGKARSPVALRGAEM